VCLRLSIIFLIVYFHTVWDCNPGCHILISKINWVNLALVELLQLPQRFFVWQLIFFYLPDDTKKFIKNTF
jgi:hypothetical protein